MTEDITRRSVLFLELVLRPVVVKFDQRQRLPVSQQLSPGYLGNLGGIEE